MLGLHLTGPVLLETILLDAELCMSFQSIFLNCRAEDDMLQHFACDTGQGDRLNYSLMDCSALLSSRLVRKVHPTTESAGAFPTYFECFFKH